MDIEFGVRCGRCMMQMFSVLMMENKVTRCVLFVDVGEKGGGGWCVYVWLDQVDGMG